MQQMSHQCHAQKVINHLKDTFIFVQGHLQLIQHHQVIVFPNTAVDWLPQIKGKALEGSCFHAHFQVQRIQTIFAWHKNERREGGSLLEREWWKQKLELKSKTSRPQILLPIPKKIHGVLRATGNVQGCDGSRAEPLFMMRGCLQLCLKWVLKSKNGTCVKGAEFSTCLYLTPLQSLPLQILTGMHPTASYFHYQHPARDKIYLRAHCLLKVKPGIIDHRVRREHGDHTVQPPAM